MAKNTPRDLRLRRHRRLRKKLAGSTERPRLSVYRSNMHMYAQIIDDTLGQTLVSASTKDKLARSQFTADSKQGQASEVGKLVAERAREAGITQVVFDRGGYKYHGRIKALADAAREAGLEF